MKNIDKDEKNIYKKTTSKEAIFFNAKVDDKVKDVTVGILRINKAMEKLKRSLDEFHSILEQKNEDIEKQKILSGKIVALKRLIYATKLGLDRTKPKLYDIDLYVIREDIVNKGLE